ncbi:MAG: UDP-2,3-diacylglucosamine diphosphatase [Candidatus Korobacteraceae bacterium]
MEACDTLILSDLHLGSEVSRAKDAVRLLKRSHFERLILLGDIFCDLNFARLKKEHWQFLSFIRKLSNPKRNVEVVWVEGNHDHGLSNVMSHLVGVRVYREYGWQFQGQRYLAIHGHQFDRFLVNSALLSNLGARAYLELQKLDFGNKAFSHLLDKLNTSWLRLTPKVSAGAMNYARQKNVDTIFCGHTHQPISLEQDGIAYFNSGSWVRETATYITVDDQGVQIREYHPAEVVIGRMQAAETSDRHGTDSERSDYNPTNTDKANLHEANAQAAEVELTR